MPHILRLTKTYFREIDLPLFNLVAILSFISIVNMYGLSGFGNGIFNKQVLYIVIGIVVMIIFSFFNYRYFKNYSAFVLIVYLISIFLLIVTFYSRSVRGTNSWIVFGQFTFEPAELTKLCLIILMAKYYSQKHIHIYQLRHIIASSIYFVIPAVIMINQPDLGSTIILGLIWASLLLAAGISKKQIIAMVLIALVIAFSAWFLVLKPYQKTRILSFINQSEDPRGAGYNLIQSKIAIGSGFWLGNGLGNASQANSGFLPEPYNDFIFAAFAEQFGFVGILVIMILVTGLVYRVLSIGSTTSSNFGKLFSVGVAVFIFSHVIVSSSVNIGLMPVTGLPFPFMSSGGSNLFSIMAGLGILQSIKRYG